MPLNMPFDLRGKKIWVAGETGMVGREVLRQLDRENIQIISASHKVLDLTNQAQTYGWISVNKPDVIIMTAGKVGGIGANNKAPAEFLFDNLSMAQNVIHGAFKGGVERLLYLGSSCIYPKFVDQPIQEEALLTGALEPTNEAYALAKIAGLKLCEYYRSQYGCDYISAMPTNLYGTHDHFDAKNSHVIPSLILRIHQAKIENKEKVVLWGTGNPLREFLYVDDLAQALIYILKNYSEASPINIGSGQEISIHDLAHQISKIVGYEGSVVFDPSYPDGTPRKILNSRKINDLGWSAKTPLNKGLQSVYEWFLSNINPSSSSSGG
jgi:GDP-L-fucose synthase